MNSDQIEGNWKQLRGRAKQQWGNLTDDDLEQIAGKREVLIGKLQQRYGIVREQAQKKVEEWLKTVDQQPASTQSGSAQSGSAQSGSTQHGSPQHETHQTAKG